MAAPEGAAPPLPPPPSYEQGVTIVAVSAFFIGLTTACIVARFYSRRSKALPLGPDDWCALVAWLLFAAGISYSIWCATVAYDLSGPTPPLEAAVVLGKELTISQFTYAFTFFFIRLSICFLLLRIFIQKWFRICIFIAMGINTCWALFVIFGQVAVCTPFAANWDPMIPGAKCNQTVKLNLFIANAVWTILYDFAIIVLPQPIIWQLQMRKRARALLSGIFVLGGIDIAMSIVRIPYIIHVDPTNLTASFYLPYLWTMLEMSLAMVAVCLPTMRPVFEKLFFCCPGLLPGGSTRRTGRTANSRVPLGNASGTGHLATGGSQAGRGIVGKYTGGVMGKYSEFDRDDVPLRDLKGEGEVVVEGRGTPSLGKEDEENAIGVRREVFVETERR